MERPQAGCQEFIIMKKAEAVMASRLLFWISQYLAQQIVFDDKQKTLVWKTDTINMNKEKRKEQ